MPLEQLIFPLLKGGATDVHTITEQKSNAVVYFKSTKKWLPCWDMQSVDSGKCQNSL